MTLFVRSWLILLAAQGWLLVQSGCGSLLGLDDYQAGGPAPLPPDTSCTTHRDCAGAPLSQDGFAATFCLAATHRCTALKSQDCTTISGPVEDDRAIVLGSLQAEKGVDQALGTARLRGASLAVDELNAASGWTRPIVLVACDSASRPLRAAEHLVQDLHVPAIIGPDSSADMIQVAQHVAIPGGAITISPGAIAVSIAELRDNDLAWQMLPHSDQRTPVFTHELDTTASELRVERARDLKLGIILRNESVEESSSEELASVSWNGMSLPDALRRGAGARLDAYDAAVGVPQTLVDQYASYAPDVLVLTGAEEVVQLMASLERALDGGTKPEFLLTDAAKVGELLTLVEAHPGLAPRVRGVGMVPSAEAQPVNEQFRANYRARYGSTAPLSELGASYDAVYAVAYALVLGAGSTTGYDIARGLHRLGSGQPVRVGPMDMSSALQQLTRGQAIRAIGTYSVLSWDAQGALASGLLEIWCVGLVNGKAGFISSGLTADITTAGVPRGENRACRVQRQTMNRPPDVQATPVMPPVVSAPPAPSAAGASSPQPMAAGADARDQAASPAGAAAPAPARDAGTAELRASIPCGVITCNPEDDRYCCISEVRPLVAYESDFSCESAPRACAAALRCTDDASCGSGSVCCLDDLHESRCRVGDSCQANERHLGCDSPTDCAAGQLCCFEGDDPTLPAATRCANDCVAFSTFALTMCDRQSQCSTPRGCLRKPDMPSVAMCF